MLLNTANSYHDGICRNINSAPVESSIARSQPLYGEPTFENSSTHSAIGISHSPSFNKEERQDISESHIPPRCKRRKLSASHPLLPVHRYCNIINLNI